MLGFRKQGLKNVAWLSLRTAVISLFGILLLTACQSNTTPTKVEGTGTVVISPAANPVSTVQVQAPYPASTQSAPGAYPSPQSDSLPTSPANYPAPGSGVIQTQADSSPYPGPANNGSSVSPTPVGQPGAGFVSPTLSPYPGPPTNPTTQPAVTVQPLATIQPSNSSTPLPTALPTGLSGSSPTAVSAPTVTPPATILPTPATLSTATASSSLQTNLLATDPSTVKLASGEPQLIVFFAYWDGNSRIMMPILLSLQNQYGTRVNFIFLDIDDPTTAQLKRVLYFDSYGVLPQSFLLDPQGKILRKWRGVIQQSDLQQALEGALNG